MTEYEECERCGRWEYLEDHHVFFGGKNRKNSERYGMVARLCHTCHRDGKDAAHRCRETDLALKKKYQRRFEAKYNREKFMEIFGRNYL